MVVLRKVGIMSVAKVLAVLMAIAGLIEGIVFASLGTMIGSIAEGTPAAALGAFGLMAIVIFPIGGAISGFIGGAISAALYNMVAGGIGGIEMDLVGMQAAMPSAPIQIPAATKPPPFCGHCGRRTTLLPGQGFYCYDCQRFT
jgi:hypothetical protein